MKKYVIISASFMTDMPKYYPKQQVYNGRNLRRGVPIPEPTADEVKALKAEFELFTKVEVKKKVNIRMK